MSRTLQSQLSQATTSTFEELGFVIPRLQVDEDQAELALAWSARVRFDGPVAGWLEIRVSDASAEALAANMLGMSQELDPAMKGDAIGEIANVICGNVVPALGTPSDIFNLEAPKVRRMESGEDTRTDEGLVLELGLEEGRAEVELCVERVGVAEEVTA